MTSDLHTFMSDANAAAHEFNLWAENLKRVYSVWKRSQRPRFQADHICYKCADAQEFMRIRALFENKDSYLYQSWISGRRIALIRLPEDIETPFGPIGFLELSDQKPDGSQKSGFDHVEVYPGAGTGRSCANLAALLRLQGIKVTQTVRPHHTTFDLVLDGGLKVRLEPERLVDKIIRDEMGR